MPAEPVQLVCNGCNRVRNPLTHSCAMHSNPSYTPLEHPNRHDLGEREYSGVHARSSRAASDRLLNEPTVFILARPTMVSFWVNCPACDELVKLPPVLLNPQLAVTHAPAGRLGVASAEFPVAEHVCASRKDL